MAQEKIPVTVTMDLKRRVAALVATVQNEVSPHAQRAISNSGICAVAIEDMINCYEKNPKALAERMGFALKTGA